MGLKVDMTSLVFCLFFCAICVQGHSDSMIGTGQWNVIYVKQCSDKEYIFNWEVEMRKINRTHSGYNLNVTLDRKLDETFAVRIDICKQVDGGCKPYQVIADNTLKAFVYKYGKEDFIKFLKLAEIEPLDFPLQPGEIKIRNYIFNGDELPIEGIYGEYIAKAYILKNYQEFACVDIAVNFTEKQDDDDDYEEE